MNSIRQFMNRLKDPDFIIITFILNCIVLCIYYAVKYYGQSLLCLEFWRDYCLTLNQLYYIKLFTKMVMCVYGLTWLLILVNLANFVYRSLTYYNDIRND